MGLFEATVGERAPRKRTIAQARLCTSARMRNCVGAGIRDFF
jgi:hypothetical protein